MEDKPEIHTLQVVALPDGRMDTSNAATYLGAAKKTLASWRYLGTGPNFVKRWNRVFYYKSDLDAWLDSTKRFTSTTQARFHLENETNE